MVKIKTSITDQGVVEKRVLDSENNTMVVEVPIILSGSSTPMPGQIRGQFIMTVPGVLSQSTDVAPHIRSSGDFTITSVFIEVKNAPTGGSGITVDVNRAGTTIFTTQANRPNIPSLGLTGTSGTPDITSLALNDLLTVDIDTSGSTAPGSDLSIMVRGVLI